MSSNLRIPLFDGLDLLPQTSIGSINLRISGDDSSENNFVTLELSRTGEDRVFINSGESAKHYMQQMDSVKELRKDVKDSNNNSIIYKSPVSVIPKDKAFIDSDSRSKKRPMAPFPPTNLS
jgi:hypothetical protein